MLTFLVHSYLPHAVVAGWLYLPLVLLFALRWGRTAGLVMAAVGDLLILSLTVTPIGRPVTYDANDYLEMVVSTLGTLMIATIAADLNRRRVAGEARRVSETERARALRQQAELLDTVSDAFIGVDRSWRYTYVNGPGERLLQRSRDQLIGKDMRQIFPNAADSPVYQQAVTASEQGRGSVFLVRLPRGRLED